MATTIWKGQLTLGLVSVPVRLYRAARKETVRMHYLRQVPTEAAPVDEAAEPEDPYTRPVERGETKSSGRSSDGLPGPLFRSEESTPPAQQVTRVKQDLISAREAEPVPRSELRKGYEYGPEQYVIFKTEELRRVRPQTSPDMQILRSVRLADIDPVYFETSYYVLPNRGGERAYTLLFAALQKTQYVALAKVAMHGREHIMVVRPGKRGLLAHTMYYTGEIRAENEFQSDLSGVTGKELELATTFIETIAGPFAPEEFKDSYREQVEALVSGKIARQEVATSGPTPQPAAAPVVDILEALKKSLELTKKPVQIAGESTRRMPGKETEIKSKRQRRKA